MLAAESAHFAPASRSCKMPMICSSVRVVCFVVHRLHGGGLYLKIEEKFRGRSQGIGAAEDPLQPLEARKRQGVFARMMDGLAAEAAVPKTVMIDATICWLSPAEKLYAPLACRLDEPGMSEYLPSGTRALCNGKTLAFQAKDAGSIPAARSIPLLVAFVAGLPADFSHLSRHAKGLRRKVRDAAYGAES